VNVDETSGSWLGTQGTQPGDVFQARSANLTARHVRAHRDGQSSAELRSRAFPEGSRETLYGALDLGTNNCRLLLAAPAVGGFRVIDAFSRIVRLGEGASISGALSERAMLRTITALRICANKLRWWKVDRFRLIATEACRMASNGQAFVERVAEETGLELEVIDRETEARLAVAGASPLIAPDAARVLLFDIGGGSTEVSWLTVEPGNYTIDAWTSVPEGVVTIAERFGGTDVTPECFAAMRGHVRPMLRDFASRVAEIDKRTVPDHMLGTSGTVTTICGVHLALRRYDRSRVDGCWLHRDDVGRITRDLLAMSYADRAAHPCIGAERADLVLAGCAILEEINNCWPVDRVRVADRGLREGILTDLMIEDGTYGRTGTG
jgi:exopolyphosphatase/guanosine-5'-triphosphate,3'-diphosphate pyrophosphatase